MKTNRLFPAVTKYLFASTLLLGAGNATAGQAIGTLNVHNLKVSESVGIAKVKVRLLRKSTKTITVRYATKPRTGLPGKDYNGTSGKLTFKPGQLTKTIRVNIIDDDIAEKDEFFKLRIFSPKNANINKGSASIGIKDYEDRHRAKKAASVAVKKETAPVVSKPPESLPLIQPSIALLSPEDNTSYAASTSIQLKAKAADKDGNIAKVEFYDNGSLVSTDYASPYTYNFSNATVGIHDITAMTTDNDGLTVASNTHRINILEDAITTGPDSLVVYPVNQNIDQQHKSTRFSVKVSQNGVKRNSFVYQSGNSAHPGWSGTLDYMQKANHWTTFSFEGAVDINAKRLNGKAIKTCIVRPLSLKIKPVIQGSTCSFTLQKPAKVSVEIDEINMVSRAPKKSGPVKKHIIQHPLFVFADPLETDIPNASDPSVLYFGPGIHRIGKEVALKNNSQVYIAGGAYVIGTLTTAEKNPKNISIKGRGVLSGIDLTETRQEHNRWGNHAIDFSKGHKGDNLLVEGITITDPLRSCIISYNPVHIHNVKLMSWSHRNDGITAGKGSVIEDNFIKVEDDNIKLYYSDQTIRRNVIWQQTSGAVFKFAWNLSGTSQNNHISDIDIIHSDVFNDYSNAEKDRPEMRSTSAIFSAMAFRKNAAFKNNSFKNIRIEEKHLYRLMGLRMVTTHQSASDSSKNVYWGDPSVSASKKIDSLMFENVQLAGVPYKQSTLYGNKGGSIRNLHFKKLKIAGIMIDNKGMLQSKNDGAGLLTAGDVSNIMFTQ